MKIKIKQGFPYYHGGCKRVDYVDGSEIDADDEEMIAVAISEGWATLVDNPAENKAHKIAPENKKAK